MGRIAAALSIFIIVAVGLGGYVLVAARTLERMSTDLAQAQFDFVLSRAQASLERTLQLGLPLAELDQSEPILEAMVASNQSVLAADVFSLDGITLFSTDRGAAGEPVPAAWRAAIAERRGERWRLAEFGHVTLGREITNDFGQPAGWAAMIVDDDAMKTPLSTLAAFIRSTLPIILLTAVASALIVAFLGRQRIRQQESVMAVFAGKPPRPSDPLAQAVAGALDTTEAADDALNRARQTMQALDAKV